MASLTPSGLAAAGVLVLAAWFFRRQLTDSLADGPNQTGNDDPGIDDAPTWSDKAADALVTVRNLILPTPAADMSASPVVLEQLKSFEALTLQPYRLGDGMVTIGWGRAYPERGPQPPAQITRETADEWFAEDVRNIGEAKVKKYVQASLTQPQFDALVSMSYNMGAASFRTIADAVNAGDDPEDAAMKITRPGTNLERGLRRRRSVELAMYRTDPNYYG